MLSFGGNGVGNLTQSAGTVIRHLIPPNKQGVTRVTKIVYTAAGTAHTLTHLRPIGRTTAALAAASGQAVVRFTAQPGASGNNLAANDLVALREVDGVTRLYTVQAVPGAYPGDVTMTGNLTAGVAQGEKVWNFGIVGDTDPVIGSTHPSVAGVASVTSTYEDREGGVFAGHEKDAPILFSSNNATAAGTLQQLSWSYSIN